MSGKILKCAVVSLFVLWFTSAHLSAQVNNDSLERARKDAIYKKEMAEKNQPSNDPDKKKAANLPGQKTPDKSPVKTNTKTVTPNQVITPGSFINDSLDAYIERGMKQWQIPGLAIAIVKDGKVLLSKGYGVREAGKESKVDENTLFIIASNSKLFTGTSLAKLEHENKLTLNDKVTKFLPWFKLYDSNSTRLANIKDMLCHRIGLKTFQGDFTFWDSNLPKDSIIWKMRYLKPVGEFRQDYGYCNSAFLVAGQVLEKVTGQTWESYVKDNFLSPLGMTNTYMNTTGLAARNNVASPHNNMYTELRKIPFDNVDNLGPATSMVSNVKDLSKWLLCQLDSGRYQGTRVIPWNVIQKTRDINILTGSRKSPFYPTHFRGYGLGLYSTDYNGRQVYWHTGGAFGHVTNVCFIPEEKLGITILTNNDNNAFFEALRYQIMDAYLGVQYTDRNQFQWRFQEQAKNVLSEELEKMNGRMEKKNTPEIGWDAFTGDFYNTVYGKITISKGDNMLVCRFQHHPELIGYMEYMDNNEFRLSYSNVGYGVVSAPFSVNNGKVFAVEIKVNDFVESDAYLFVRDEKGLMIK